MATTSLLRLVRQLAATMLLAGMTTCIQAQVTADPLPTPVPGSLQGRSLDGLPGGVILNRTITIVGHDFYQYFSTGWRTRDNNERYSISIVERPTAIRGSEIWIEYRNKRVFRTFLSPARSAVKAISQRAVGIVYNTIVDMELQQLLFEDHDLAREELQ